MMFYYYIDNDLCKAKGINDNLDWLIINHLYKLINNNKD